MQSKLELVGEEVAPPPQNQKEQAAAIQMLRIGLTALSQRFIVAVASLVDFILITSAFALWWSIITVPTTLQMETATIYSLFILAVIWMRRRSQ
jgi:hypothetical protein